MISNILLIVQYFFVLFSYTLITGENAKLLLEAKAKKYGIFTSTHSLETQAKNPCSTNVTVCVCVSERQREKKISVD